MSYPASRWRFSGLTCPDFRKAWRGGGPVHPARRRSRPALEWLEHRLVLSSFTVTDNSDSPADTGSLRYAITQVDASTDASNTITINSTLSGGQTITLGSTLPSITKNVAIVGPGADVVSVSGNHAFGVFGIDPGAVVTISGLTVKDGMAKQGAGIFNLGTLSLTRVIVTGNSAFATAFAFGSIAAEAFGGGIYSASRSVLTINECSISDNSASGSGTANRGGPVAGLGQGGGIYATGPVTVTDSTFEGNTASGSFFPEGRGFGSASGGAIKTTDQVTVIGSTIANNTAVGAGIDGYRDPSATFKTAATGGGISAGGVTLVDSTVSGNVASSSYDALGGGIETGGLAATNSTIANNRASGAGGPGRGGGTGPAHTNVLIR